MAVQLCPRWPRLLGWLVLLTRAALPVRAVFPVRQVSHRPQPTRLRSAAGVAPGQPPFELLPRHRRGIPAHELRAPVAVARRPGSPGLARQAARSGVSSWLGCPPPPPPGCPYPQGCLSTSFPGGVVLEELVGAAES